jgi:hypothetical protein
MILSGTKNNDGDDDDDNNNNMCADVSQENEHTNQQ